MDHSLYKTEKQGIKFYAVNNESLKHDKPLFNMLLNDYLDALIKSNQWLKFSEKRRELYFNWLANYVCDLHA